MQLVTRTDIFRVPFEKLEIKEGFNIREDYGDIEGLAASIKANGCRNPLRGYRNKDKESGKETYVVVDGHRRYNAIKLLYEQGNKDISVGFILQPKGTNQEECVVDMFVTNEGKELTAIEKAIGIKRLIDYGWTIKEIALKIGKTEVHVAKLNSLNNAPKKFYNLVKEGILSATQATDMIAKGEVESFMERYEAGEFTAPPVVSESIQLITDPAESVATPEPPKQRKITAKNINGDKINSWKSFGKWAKMVNPDLMPPHKQQLFSFLCKMMNNQANELDFAKYFKEEDYEA